VGKKETSVRERLKGFNSIAIKFVVKVTYIAVEFIKIFIRIPIKRQRRARRDVR